MGQSQLTVSLVGNPNSGKTTVFNNLTGARQHVGNYPGVTVEKKEGYLRYKDTDFVIVDLPGTYSLTAYSMEEVVTRNFIVNNKPDVVVDIADASNLERNLYLTIQLLELGRPVLLALNMVDVAEKNGLKISDKKLSASLGGVPVVRTVGIHKSGMDALLEQTLMLKQATAFKMDYGTDVEAAIARLEEALQAMNAESAFPNRWVALKLLEQDKDILDWTLNQSGGAKVIAECDAVRASLHKTLGEEVDLFIAGQRYQFVGRIYQQAVEAQDSPVLSTSDKIDKILTNRILGLPIFFALMWVVFNVIYTFGEIPSGWIEDGVANLGKYLSGVMADGPLKSLLVDGIVAGVGSVLVFVPKILMLFFAIALLEDTGYMARAAFIMDRVMRRFGLHGKSFIPLLLGFGCSVTSIMGSRTLENPRDRIITMLIAPLMSCSAKLPVYTILIAAFFDADIAGNVLFSIYVLGIALSFIVAWVFRSTVFQGPSEPFVMELPPYRMPLAKSVLLHMWERTALYLQKAGTIILAASVLMWFLVNYPSDVEYSKNYEELTAAAETSYTEQIAQDVYAPLAIEDLDGNEDLKDLTEKIQAIEDEFDEKTAELEEESDEYAELLAAKETDLKELESQNNELFPFADKYVLLQHDLKETQEKLEHEKASEKLEKSYAGRIGKGIEPVIRPLGFDWRIGISLLAGVSAKEVVISTMGTIYSLGDTDENSISLKHALAQDPHMNPLVAYSLMVFVLVYSPCLAALAVMKRETASWKWPAVSMVYATTLAWIVTFIVYQGGLLLGFGG